MDRTFPFKTLGTRMTTNWDLGALLAAVVICTMPAVAFAEEFEDRIRRAMREVADRYHLDDEYVRIEELVSEAVGRSATGTSEEAILNEAKRTVWKAWSDFPPRGSVHSPTTRYRLPFPLWFPHLVAQGNFGFRTHGKEPNLHAFDFALPPGARILAARAGTVARIIDGFPPGDDLPASLIGPKTDYANAVYIQHDDGTYANYTHLQKGIVVRSGQAVKAGELLAYSGASGSPEGPHLHFGVMRRDSSGRTRSVPSRFGPKGSRGFVPDQGDVVGGPPKATVPLRVSFQGKAIQEGGTVVLPRGGKEQLAVEVKVAGAYRRVTEDKHTYYHSITPWSVLVSESGLLHMTYGPGYGNSPDENRDAGRIMVLFAKPKARQFGQLVFNLRTK